MAANTLFNPTMPRTSETHLEADRLPKPRDPDVRLAPPLPADVQTAETVHADALRIKTTNVCLLRLLERIAAKFNDAGIPLMALKGAALNLTVYDRPDERPMSDLDLLIRPEHVDEAFALLESAGCLRGEPLVREDFFPRFHYETEFTAGRALPMRIDLHVRPFRPLRTAGLVPPRALWERAEPVSVGRERVLIPSAEDMLIHLAAHSAIHGNPRAIWLEDLKRWTDARRSEMDWQRFLATVGVWGLALPVREGIERAERDVGPICPTTVRQRLAEMRVGWRDRLSLRHAPHDAEHPVRHVAVNVLCTPGWRFRLGYLQAVLVPGREHMEDWYFRRHWGWLPWAHVLRCVWPLAKHIRPLWSRFSKIDVRKSGIHGVGVFATRVLAPGQLIARYRGKPTQRDGVYVAKQPDARGGTQHYEITGKLKYLSHCCSPNAELNGFELRALRRIDAGKEITINYGEAACDCEERSRKLTEMVMSA